MNAAQREVLVSFLISQGQTRANAELLVGKDPKKVQSQMDKLDQEQAKSQPAPIDPNLTMGAGQQSEVSAEFPQGKPAPQGPVSNPDPQVQHPNTPAPAPGEQDQGEQKKNQSNY